jgi:phospholipid/cholesterol/gamma-HCH transport system ATP-binding protein
MQYAIEIKNLTKAFGPHTILKNLNFNVPKGKITSILGFSGAGKSTLMKLILGIIRPTIGNIKVLGQDLSLLKDDELREFRRNYGMVFQYAALFDSFSALNNVTFPLAEFTTLTKFEREEKAKNLLNAVGIEVDSIGKLPSELSGGMRKRVGLARALALSPRVMLYDEPTTGLDPITTKMVNDLIRETAVIHKDIELTSVIISHDIKATLDISDYIAFLDHGNIIEYLPVNEFKESKNTLVRKFLDLCL